MTIIVPSGVPVGAPFSVRVKANPGTHYYYTTGDDPSNPTKPQLQGDDIVQYEGGFRLQFDSGETATATDVQLPATVTLNRPGYHVAQVSALIAGGGSIDSRAAQFIAGAVSVVVTAPGEQNPPAAVPLMETGAGVTVTATADWLGGLAVTAQSGQNTVGLSATDAAGTNWQGVLHLDPMPVGPRSITVVATATLDQQRTSTVVRTVTAIDAAAPHVTVSHPTSGGKVLLGTSGAVKLNGVCSDTQSGMSGGKAAVGVSLSPIGPFAAAEPGSPSDFSLWSATVTAPGIGPFTVYLRASDAAGNAAEILPWPLEAVSDYLPATVDDRLSETEYLAALMVFARDAVLTPGGQVKTADLTAALQQPVDRMSQPLSAAAVAGLAPVNELRLPVELLRARIASGGIPQAPGRQGEIDYLQTAYQTLLVAAGTSYDEMRQARGADTATRAALAARLGLTLHGPAGSAEGRPDQLDTLTLDGAALTEAELERLFALPQTTAGLDPLRPIQQSQLLTWQLVTQASQWQAEDLNPPSNRAFTVVVDPDVITTADIRAGSTLATRIDQLFKARSGLLAEHAVSLTATVAGAADPPGSLAALLAAGLPNGTPELLSGWQAQEAQGVDISDPLAAAGLDRTGYRYLLSLAGLTAVAHPTAREWDDGVQVLTGAFRRRKYPEWLSEESGIILSPEFFTCGTERPDAGIVRIDPRARADWTGVLSARTTRRQNLSDAATAVIAAAEQRSLPVLRDALLADVAATVTGDVGEFLTGMYQVDFRASGAVATTRMAQAIASLQTLLELVRSGDVSAASPAHVWTLGDSQAFDVAWTWMGGIDSWRQAISAFLFPEAALAPQVLDPAVDPTSGASEEFHTLVLAFQDLPGDASPSQVLDLVTDYCRARSPWLINQNPPEPGQLSYLSGRNRDHQGRLAAWSGSLLVQGNDVGPAAAGEIFWAVPMLAAQRLLAAGHHQEAMDWLWVVYPYNDPQAVSIYERINDEGDMAPTPPDMSFPPNWTKDLNPFHLIAARGGRPAPYLRNTLLTIITGLIDYGNSEFSVDRDASLGHARTLYLTAQGLLAHPRFVPVQPSGPGEAALALPQLDILTTRVQTQLAKLRQGRNIAGLPRLVAGAPSSNNAIRQPTPYHFKILLARAQQMAQQAGQLEAQYLSLLEKYDTGTLKLSDARFAAGLAELQSKVHEARVQEADDAAKAADTQQTKATVMEAAYRQQLEAPPNQYETTLLDQYGQLRDLQDVVSVANGAIGIAQAAASAASLDSAIFSFGAKVALGGIQIAGYGVKAGAEIFINDLQSQMQANQLRAGIETRREETAIQHTSAAQDVLVATAQQTVAKDQRTIAKAEQDVSTRQNEQAKATLALLTSQFTSPDLYLWMSDTLGSVYRYFLQQATATARLAQDQLAFERAEPVRTFIGVDYWKAPQGSRKAPVMDTKGMTGAELLLQDLLRLDQYAFSTDERRLNLSQTFSLAQILPMDFLQFRRTGQLSFATPMSWFSQDFPDHYQRLIRQVHLSLIALVPPDRGIRATLSNTGISRVTTPGIFGSFTDVVLRRDPVSVAVTSPLNATGVFDLDLQPEMLLPFQGSGVATQWQFSLPKAANPFAFASIADLLVRIDYTALADPDYGALVIRELNANLDRSSDCVFSLARDFPDQWYELNNPGPDGVRSTTLTLSRNNFPADLQGLLTTQVAIGLSTAGTDPVPQVQLSLNRTIGGTSVGGSTETDGNGIASTRRGAIAWSPLAGTDPTGSWQLSLGATADPLFTASRVEDLLFVISWHGRAPAWPA
ncbi:hypothetical protein [Arthrobacter sp. SAFR-044]|uniref:Tc toxin subunit A-related protein n=1 Tax=Arthrobacter sp. SAFR-044 TaxID=3387278 RepID=UPI003F7BB61F